MLVGTSILHLLQPHLDRHSLEVCTLGNLLPHVGLELKKLTDQHQRHICHLRWCAELTLVADLAQPLNQHPKWHLFESDQLTESA